ncbi:MAG: cbb3-type cytochrome oxidase assembly protein CcoS [Gallionellaceae bacterium]|nr:cbb3-type cytochrome oxidase assembly protein CcoS [Gallionellaceae bacterium]
MEVIYSLIPGMTFFGLLFVVILVWAVRKGQYEDMEGNASRILLDDDEDVLVAGRPKKEPQQKEASSEQDGKPPATGA